MTKTQAKFDTRQIPEEIDVEGGWAMYLKDRQTIEDEQVFNEVVKEKTLPLDPDLLRFAFLAVLKTMTGKVARDCNPRKIGNFLKVAPSMRGKLPHADSPFDEKTCSCVITVTSLSGLEKLVDLDYVSFVNNRRGVTVTVKTLAFNGSAEDGVIKDGISIVVTGSNLEFITGDTITMTWTEDDEEHTIQVVPTESDNAHMVIAWPSALDDIDVGTDVTFDFYTRGGNADASAVHNVKHAVVVE